MEGSRYEVPHTLVGKKIVVRRGDGVLRIFDGDKLMATLTQSTEKGKLARERLSDNLTRLKLSRLRESVPDMVKAAEVDSWSYLHLLQPAVLEVGVGGLILVDPSAVVVFHNYRCFVTCSIVAILHFIVRCFGSFF